MEENEIIENNNDLKEYMLKEVDLIQNIIKRMASNSFVVKGWTITLVVATLLLKDDNSKICISFIPLILFWYLDSYFLYQERKYRNLYNWVIENRLNTREHLLDMNADRLPSEASSPIPIMFSKTLLCFYGLIFLLLSFVIVYLVINKFLNTQILGIFIIFK